MSNGRKVVPDSFETYLSYLPVNSDGKTISFLRFNLNKNTWLPLIENRFEITIQIFPWDRMIARLKYVCSV